ncbi:giy-yig catalytic domain containing protein [Gigaspora margarita]|uniref:Giy-yig catalytic domain containing protein n=1 Tax=Gigaspora margarita TaxID=4874 RepID=A0A8H3XG90_GIGMA|nr:giy-yig catalytic domain containing protein [Gigaspora margarita]
MKMLKIYAMTLIVYTVLNKISELKSPILCLRQHNGEITTAAKRTKAKRPWKFSLIVYGFLNKKAKLQFEWAWQYPILADICRILIIRKMTT